MYKTCPRCGIVDENHICPYKPPKRPKESTQLIKFRNTQQWQKKRKEICIRDRYLCRVCLENRYNTVSTLTFQNVEVHHIVPLAEDFRKRLDNDNLITLCQYHHKMAERGEIPREELQKIISPHP